MTNLIADNWIQKAADLIMLGANPDKFMVLNFEGPDGAGKTSIANYIAEKYGYEFVAMSYPKTEEEKKQMFMMYVDKLINIKLSGKKVIIDRGWVSEAVYGPIMRGKSALSLDEVDGLNAILKGIGGKVVYITAPSETLIDRAFARGEEYVNKEQLKSIAINYDKVVDKLHYVDVIRYENS